MHARSPITLPLIGAICATFAQPGPARGQAEPAQEPQDEPGDRAEAEPPASRDPLPVLPAARVLPAPRPGSISGIARPESTTAVDHALWVPRGLLFVPKWGLKAVFAPIRGGLYLQDRYEIFERLMDFFFNDARTFGIYPIFSFESEFGADVELRLVHRNLFGRGESLRARAAYGGEYDQLAGFEIDSGRRFDDMRLYLFASFERRPDDRFYGIGNADEIEDVVLPTMRNPVTGAGVETKFAQRVGFASLRDDIRLADDLFALLSATYTHRELSEARDLDDDEFQLEDTYETGDLQGWDGVDDVHTQLELRYDTRRSPSPFISPALNATGLLATAWTGYSLGIAGDDTAYLRSGAEVQRFFDIYKGRRLIGLRARVESITGDRDDVPFMELPRLGGAELLRGYPTDRFRDKALTLVTAEYAWELNRRLSALAFVDAGRVWPELSDVAFEDIRVGYGVGVQMHSARVFWLRAHIAGSEEGVFANLKLSPFYDPEPRIQRRGR